MLVCKYLEHPVIVVEGDRERYLVEFGQPVEPAARHHGIAVVIGGLGRVKLHHLRECAVAVVRCGLPAGYRLLVEQIHRHFGGIFAVSGEICIAVII